MMACPYCIKYKWSNKFEDNYLKLDREPSCKEIIDAIEDLTEYNEIVFCGYGDPLVRVEVVKEVAKWIKEHGSKVRINTAGLANRYYRENILLKLKGLIDIISISLNGSTSKEHNEINKPMFKEEAFGEILNFIKEAKNYLPEVIITTIEFPGFNVSKVEKIAKDIGVKFRLRPYLDYEE
jgi:TatD DNase family protein